MTERVLICLDDTGFAHVVAARLMRDGAEAVVIKNAADLPDEASEACRALCVQDRYKSGEVGSSLLRQIKMKRGDALPGVFVLTGNLAAPDRQILEKQYSMKDFLSAEDSPHALASAMLAVLSDLEEPELVLHPDEAKNEFDIDIESIADGPALESGFDGNSDAHTIEMSMSHMKAAMNKERGKDKARLAGSDMPPRKIQDEVTMGNPAQQAAPTRVSATNNLDSDEVSLDLGGHTVEGSSLEAQETGLLDLSLPQPGSDNDIQLRSQESSEAERTGKHKLGGFAEGGTNETRVDLRPDPVSMQTNVEKAVSSDSLDSDELDLLDNISENAAEASADAAADSAPMDAAPPQTNIESNEPAVDETNGGTPADNQSSEGENEEDEDMAQVQELKRALLQKKRQLDSAQKRIEDLETKVSTMASDSPALSEDEMPKEGVLEDIRYPLLLSRARTLAFSGALKMQLPGDVTRTIYLKNGLPVGFRTSEPGEKIGKMLVSQGRLTDADYVKAATRMVERGIKLHEALVELGLIDAETLEVEIRNLTREQIIAGFELLQGRFTVHEGDAPDDNVALFDYGPGEVYVTGYRSYAPKQEMQALFEQLRPKYLIANDRLASYRPKLGLTGTDERLLRLLGEAYTVEEAVERADVVPDDAARVIAALQALDLVEEWSPGVKEFRARLTSERQHFQQEISRIREETSTREKELFAGFERALGKITSAIENNASAPTLSPTLTPTPAPTPTPPKPATISSVSTTVAGPSPSAPSKPSSSDSLKTEQLNPALLSSQSKNQFEKKSDPPTLSPVADSGKSGGLLGDPAKLAKAASPAEEKFHEAIRQAAEDRLDEAEVTLREAVRMDATRPDFLTSLARVLLANPRYEREGTLPVVKTLLERAVQLSPDNEEANALHDEIAAELGAA